MDREQLRKALEREIDEWLRSTFDEIRNRLRDDCAYERGEGESRYQVEVVLLEATAEYVNVSIAVDDGGWSRCHIRRRAGRRLRRCRPGRR